MDTRSNKSGDNKPYTGVEKRSSSRMAVTTKCMLVLEDSHEILANIENVSCSGVFITFDHDDKELFVNQRVWVDFSLSIKEQEHALKVNGVVVRANSFGIGIAFRTVERSKLEPLIEKLVQDKNERNATRFGFQNG